MDLMEMRRRKKALGLTNEMIAEISGVPLGTVQKAIGGTTKSPRIETVMALEETLKEGGLADRALKGSPEGCEEYSAEGGRISESQFAYKTDKPTKGERANESQFAYSLEYSEGTKERERRAKRQGEYTVEDYLGWPDEERVELIDGKIYNMAAPTVIHQFLAGQLYYQLMDHKIKNDLDCMPGIAPIDVQLDKDDRTMVQPDVIIDCRKKKNRIRIIGAPDFVLEILSESTRSKDVIIKTAKYMNAGCREYWIVDPKNETVLVYDFENDDYPISYSFTDKIPVRISGGKFKIDFAVIRQRAAEAFGEDYNKEL